MKFRALLVAFLALCLGVLTACSNGPAEAVDKTQLTYDEIVGTGLANTCPEIQSFTRGSITLEPNKTYQVSDLCLEPQEYFVKEEPANKRQSAEYIKGKVLTRKTSSLEQISGTITLDDKGVLTFVEKDGIDFQPITVLLPGGEEVPFFFTLKNLVGKTESGFTALTTSSDFVGNYSVPSYRGAGFLDPKGRGLYTGYDTAIALPAGGDSTEYKRLNTKRTGLGKGTMSLQVTKIDADTGEISGVFEGEQPSDTDLGAKDPLDVKVRGVFYARVAVES
jgi:photosystem II oxygen-evolving enhancer protein 1